MLRLNRTKSVVDAFMKRKYRGNCFIKTPLSNSHLGFGPPHKTSLIHSCSFLLNNNNYNNVGGSVIMSHPNTVVNDALILFNKMTHQQPLPWADEFITLLEVIRRHDFIFYKKGVVSYSTLFDRLISENRVHEAHGLFNKLIKDQLCQPDTLLYNTIIKALCSFPKLKNGALATSMLDDALKLFKQMVSQQGISPDVVTYNSLISGCCEHRRWRRATLLLHDMVDSSSISPNVETFNLLVNAFCNERMIEEAYHVLYVMQERGIAPNIVTFNSLIAAHFRKSELKKARSLIDQMVSRDIDGFDVAAAYANLLQTYCMHIQMDDAMLIYHEMNKRGLKPSHATYNTMISGLFSAGYSGEAHKVLDDMRAQGQMLDKSTYLLILYDLSYKGQIEEALSLFHFLGDDDKLNSDNSAYNELICGAFKCKKPHIARELFEDLSVKGRKPDQQTYATMIAGFCGEGLIKDAKQLFLKMEESGFLPIRGTYIFLLRGYLKSKCYDDVKTLLLKMSKTYFRLDALTYTWLQDPIADGSLDNSFINLIGKLKDEDDEEDDEEEEDEEDEETFLALFTRQE